MVLGGSGTARRPRRWALLVCALVGISCRGMQLQKVHPLKVHTQFLWGAHLSMQLTIFCATLTLSRLLCSQCFSSSGAHLRQLVHATPTYGWVGQWAWWLAIQGKGPSTCSDHGVSLEQGAWPRAGEMALHIFAKASLRDFGPVTLSLGGGVLRGKVGRTDVA